MSKILWTIQALLAALFLFAGGMKLALPAAELAKQASLPVEFLRFIGVCEVLGALGMVLPGLFKVRRELTSLAAVGLVAIMVGATVISASPVPAVVGALAAVVAWGRRTARVPAVVAQ